MSIIFFFFQRRMGNLIVDDGSSVICVHDEWWLISAYARAHKSIMQLGMGKIGSELDNVESNWMHEIPILANQPTLSVESVPRVFLVILGPPLGLAVLQWPGTQRHACVDFGISSCICIARMTKLCQKVLWQLDGAIQTAPLIPLNWIKNIPTIINTVKYILPQFLNIRGSWFFKRCSTIGLISKKLWNQEHSYHCDLIYHQMFFKCDLYCFMFKQKC